ncbi:hypothetical protein [Variovorax sp.]|jgi:hypothetical protein|uniref:hypothetical protein n=1 Tax=Variovorax sp. TaxID=1871043 RepID=UPI0037DA705D
MPTPVLYVYVGAQRLQAAWRARANFELRMLSDNAYDVGDESLASDGEWPATVLAALEALGRACQSEPALRHGTRLRVLVSDAWVPSASVPWNNAQYRAATALAAARDELREAGHEIVPGDLLRLDDAPLRQPRLAVCYPASLVEQLDLLAAALKTRVDSITTLSALAWRGNDAPGQAPAHSERVLAILEPGDAMARQVILVRGQQASACIDEVVIRPLQDSGRVAGRELTASVMAVVQRLGWNAMPSPALSEAGTLFTVTDLIPIDPLTGISGPLAWWTQPQSKRDGVPAHALDAVARAARPSFFKLLLLAAVLVGLGLTGTALWRGEVRLREALEMATAVRRAAVVPAPPSPSVEQIKRIAAINSVVSELNIPLPRLLRAMQPPKDIRVGLLGLELVAGRERGPGAAGIGDARVARPTLKVHAEAQESTDMTRYVAFLSEREPLDRAYLVRHEVPDNAVQPGGPRAPYRFTVEVTWKD